MKNRACPYNYRIALSTSEALNPKSTIERLESDKFFRKELNAEVTDKNIIFTHNGNKVSVGRNEFGGMIWWHSNLFHIAKENKATEKNSSWWVHMDRLPLDHNFKKTIIFVSYLGFYL